MEGDTSQSANRFQVKMSSEPLTSTPRPLSIIKRLVTWCFLVSVSFSPSIHGSRPLTTTFVYGKPVVTRSGRGGNTCEVITNKNGTVEITAKIAEESAEKRMSFSLSYNNEGTKEIVAVLNFIETGYYCQTNSGYNCQKLNNYTCSFTSLCASKGEYWLSKDSDEQPTVCTFKDKTSESNPNTSIDRETGSDGKNTIVLSISLGIGIGIGIVIAALIMYRKGKGRRKRKDLSGNAHNQGPMEGVLTTGQTLKKQTQVEGHDADRDLLRPLTA